MNTIIFSLILKYLVPLLLEFFLKNLSASAYAEVKRALATPEAGAVFRQGADDMARDRRLLSWWGRLFSGQASEARAKPVLTWRHGTTVEEATSLLKSALAATEYGSYVKVSGSSFSANIWATIALEGHVTDNEVVVTRCDRRKGPEALAAIRGALSQMFPGGEV